MPSRAVSSALAAIVAFVSSGARAETTGDDPPALIADSYRLNDPDRRFALRARIELGSLGVLEHRIQYGNTTQVDYREDADQDTLFFFARLSAEFGIGPHHSLIFLYQPLNLQTESIVGRELRIGQVTFPADSPVRFGYGFDFYRLAYQYDIFDDARRELAFGGGFQLRNARVSFLSGDGSQGFTETNLGVVPLLHVRGRYTFDNALFLEAELDGWVSPIPGQGKRDGQLALGAITDFAVRGGVRVTRSIEAFLALRYLGGGFRGQSSEDTPLSADDPWSANWLHTLTVSLGLGLY